jgi:hypothetical protein
MVRCWYGRRVGLLDGMCGIRTRTELTMTADTVHIHNFTHESFAAVPMPPAKRTKW